MKLILTHDNADFDAVAAMLAAHKLDPDSVPVLPQRVNRNVAQFLTLYAEAFPFIRRDELRRGGTVEHVTVVDTQSFATARGMRPDTPVHFIDHHPLARELSTTQRFTGETVGATTTLLVEQLHAQEIDLEPLTATLFMLGIYEDTGSLIYGTTTARDIWCASWLLKRGADLDVVREFLQHRLMPEQRLLYEQLLENPETHLVNGHVVIVTSATTYHPVDEIATLAHKLRALYEPSAVFVLVQLDADIQLVARGTTDAIDVSIVAQHFGGGGHGRAAAALIRDRTLPDVCREILDLLPEIVVASIRVDALMSVGVQTVRATDRIESAVIQMQRTGHEGFPVMEGEQIVGLLTRRAVDRAMNHGLVRQLVQQIMEAGQVTVTPDDSIDVLQQRMMRSGWGQIPVVDQKGTLIGVVTRTDLIKRWGQRPDDVHQDDTAQRMQQTIPPGLWRLFQAIARQAQVQRVGLYVVGGFVRDLLLESPNHDVDLVVEGNAIALVRAIQTAYGGDMRSHAQFGTAKWLLDAAVARALDMDIETAAWPAFIDFVTARTEFYERPTALPTVQRGSIKLDLLRRDFTINTLAIRLAPEPFGTLLDFYGGEPDLQDGVIRVLHSLSFVDDPTRILRAVRLEQRLEFQIEPRTEELIQSAIPLLDRVSGDRIRHELAFILDELQPLRALARLEQLGVLRAIHAELVIDEWVCSAFHIIQAARERHPWPALATFDNWMLTTFALFTSRLPEEELEQLGKRLQFSRSHLDHLHYARAAIALLPELSREQPPSAIVRLLKPLDEVGWLVAWVAAPDARTRGYIVRFVTEWRFIKPVLNGRDVHTITGLKPGPIYSVLLGRLRQAWLDGEITTPEAEHSLLLHLAKNPAALLPLLPDTEN